MAPDDFDPALLNMLSDLRHPIAYLAQPLPWDRSKQALASACARSNRTSAKTTASRLAPPARQTQGRLSNSVGKGKAREPQECGVKVGMAVTPT